VKLRTIAILLILAATTAVAQSKADQSSAAQTGFLFSLGFDGSFDSSGHTMDLGTAAGYRFNRHFQADVGVPFYFLSSPNTGTATGVGDAALAMRLLFGNPKVNYASSLTTFVPTGNQNLGLSTGRVTFDWTNHFDHSFGRVTPNFNIGLADTVMNSRYFVRPFTTLGFNTHADGGASVDLFKNVSVEGSAYGIMPSGTQKMYSRQVRAGAAGNPAAQHGRAFESSHFTTGTADLTSDHGFSGGLDLSPAPCMDVYGGYTRSVKYALDEVSFGIGLNVGQLMHQDGCKKK
jgi:hypothetical protein